MKSRALYLRYKDLIVSVPDIISLERDDDYTVVLHTAAGRFSLPGNIDKVFNVIKQAEELTIHYELDSKTQWVNVT